MFTLTKQLTQQLQNYNYTKPHPVRPNALIEFNKEASGVFHYNFHEECKPYATVLMLVLMLVPEKICHCKHYKHIKRICLIVKSH